MYRARWLAFFIPLFLISQIRQTVTPQFRGDVSHVGIYDSDSCRVISSELWKVNAGSSIRSSPVMFDGKIYFGSSDRFFYCLDARSGKEKWRYETGSAIQSSPGAARSMVYFQDRANTLYALNAETGEEKWKVILGVSLPYPWSFDYYQSSPLIADDVLFIGSGDGNMYAVKTVDGSVVWTFAASSLVRSTPAESNGSIFFGDCSGKFYSLSAKTGKERWTFRTAGDTLKNGNFGFDRNAVISSASIKDGIVVFGGRDGYLYALDEKSGRQRWKFDYGMSWIISTAAIKDTILVTGTSDGGFFHALHLRTGKEIWRFSTRQPFWSSPIIVSNTVVAAGNDGFIYTADLSTGKELSRYRLGDKIFSSPIADHNIIYIGCDNGNIYALKTTLASAGSSVIHRAVFWLDHPPVNFSRFGVDVYLRDYLSSFGFAVLDSAGKVTEFFKDRIADREPSVVVFATNYFPGPIIKGKYRDCFLHQYLTSGGKVVVLGPNPAIYEYNDEESSIVGMHYARSDTILGIVYPYDDLRSTAGFYPSMVTGEGKKWGLTRTVTGHSSIPPEGVTVLARDELGRGAEWVKNFGGREGSGFVQLWFNQNLIQNIDEIRKAAEYGLK